MSKSICTSYLAHHGILGQKWGKRNGPPYPIDPSEHSSSEKKAGWRKSLDGGSQDSSKKNRPSGGVSSSSKTKTSSMSNDELKEKIAKAILVAGAVSLTAAAAYKLHDKITVEMMDSILESGTELKRVALEPNDALREGFYAAKDKDAGRYVGLYGNQLKAQMQFSTDGIDKFPHQLTIDVVKDVKVPSVDHAAGIFADMYKNDPKIRDNVLARANTFKDANWLNFGWENTKQGKTVNDALNRLNDKSKPLTDKEVKNLLYPVFNMGLVLHDDTTQPVNSAFFDKLKENGYGAILDLNDRRYSGYKSKDPVIVFDMDSVVKSTARKLEDTEIQKETKNFVKDQLVGIGAKAIGGLATVGAAGVVVDSEINKAVKQQKRARRV